MKAENPEVDLLVFDEPVCLISGVIPSESIFAHLYPEDFIP